jgi:hypothetical protein
MEHEIACTIGDFCCLGSYSVRGVIMTNAKGKTIRANECKA